MDHIWMHISEFLEHIVQERIKRLRDVVVAEGKKGKKNVKLLRHVQLFAIPWTVACQAPPSSRQEYWSGLPFSSPGNLPDPGTGCTINTLCTARILTRGPCSIEEPGGHTIHQSNTECPDKSSAVPVSAKRSKVAISCKLELRARFQ